MDTASRHILQPVRDGDLVLINGAYLPSSNLHSRPTYADHLLVVVNNVERIRRGEDSYFILVAPISPQEARYLLLPHQHTDWRFNVIARQTQALPIENFMRHGFSSVNLNPSIEVLRATIWQCECPFRCIEASVRITPKSVRELGISVCHGRVLQRSFTLCPSCMGTTLFQRHEELVQIWSSLSNTNDSLIRDHIRQINAQRRFRHLGPFPYNIDLPTLAFGTRTYLTMQYRASDPNAADTEIRPLSGLISKPASYYMVNGVMVSSDECLFCKDSYHEDERVIELDCGHRFHGDCLMPWLDQGTKTCPTCRAPVQV